MRSLLPIALLAAALMLFGMNAQRVNAYTPEQANQIINSTSTYIDSVNQSGYLVFYPNLTQAYSYLDMAEKNYTVSPDRAVSYANNATASAMRQYQLISEQRAASFVVMAVLTVVTAVAVFRSMRNVRQKKRF